MAAVIDKPDDSRGLLREGKILTLMQTVTHPAVTTIHVKQVITVWLLGKYGNA